MAESHAPGAGPETAERVSRVREPQFEVATAGTNGAVRRHAGPPHALFALQRSAGNAAVAVDAGRAPPPAVSSAAPLQVAPASAIEADGPAGALGMERLLATDVSGVGQGGSAPPRGVTPTEPGA